MLSSKMDFVVFGDDVGFSKFRKIKEYNIKIIDEEGLFYFIKIMFVGGGGGKGFEVVRKKCE